MGIIKIFDKKDCSHYYHESNIEPPFLTPHHPTGSRWMEINKRITAWVNKHKEFPDYVDILNLVKKVTKDSSLPFRPETVRVQGEATRKGSRTVLHHIVFQFLLFIYLFFFLQCKIKVYIKRKNLDSIVYRDLPSLSIFINFYHHGSSGDLQRCGKDAEKQAGK